MQLDIAIEGDIMLVRPGGELDISNTDEFRDALEKALNENKVGHLVFNLSDVMFLDSSCLGVVLGRYKRVNATGGRVSITNAKPHVHRILQLSGLFHLLDEFNTEEEAISSYTGRGQACR